MSIPFLIICRGIIGWSINIILSNHIKSPIYCFPYIEHKLILRTFIGSFVALFLYSSLKVLDISVTTSIFMMSPIYAFFTDFILFRKPIVPTAIILTITGFSGVLLIINPFSNEKYKYNKS